MTVQGKANERDRMVADTRYSSVEIEEARGAIKRAVMVRFGGDLLGTALVGVDVSDADAIAYLDGATIDELLEAT